MRAADAAAVSRLGRELLVARAGYAVGATAREMLGSIYGRRIAVVAGPGLNGADGRVAATWLVDRGAHVDVFDAHDAPSLLAGYDLVLDAAFGIGCSRPYFAPDVDDRTQVLAVDVPSGLDADSGDVLGRPMVADVTLALGAVKPGHLIGPAVEFVGELRFAGLGIVDSADSGIVEETDMAHFVRQHRDDHKWRHAVLIIAGSETMPGAAILATRGALAAGASMVRVCVPGVKASRLGALPPEAVRVDSTIEGLEDIVVTVSTRLHALVIGPGIGRDVEVRAQVRSFVQRARVPIVLDADGLHAVDISWLANREHPESPIVLTPHDGEYTALVGREPGIDRLAAARSLARDANCVVLLKGPTTVVADPDGHVRVVTVGTPALATAGTGDVLAGLIAGSLARGHPPLAAAALAAQLHGMAGRRLPLYGTALELGDVVGDVLGELTNAG
jgi:ADP-dependent NAD(P)H-hydrate dehydratase / NAD(P)H-hydrate epimerase